MWVVKIDQTIDQLRKIVYTLFSAFIAAKKKRPCTVLSIIPLLLVFLPRGAGLLRDICFVGRQIIVEEVPEMRAEEFVELISGGTGFVSEENSVNTEMNEINIGFTKPV